VSRPQGGHVREAEESSQHLKLLYVRSSIDNKPISRMLIDGGVAINLMSYSVFRKLGREDDKLVKTNLMLNNGGPGCHLHGAHYREQVSRYHVLHH
jgi:NurA-like 5'-3' nuclease